MILAEQVRAAVARLAAATREGLDVRVTVSAGVAANTPLLIRKHDDFRHAVPVRRRQV